jgi:hypothetical protein
MQAYGVVAYLPGPGVLGYAAISKRIIICIMLSVEISIRFDNMWLSLIHFLFVDCGFDKESI